jgi:ABC-type polysaccharide/polyol phosphate transport system ATPase subunit
MSRTVIQVEGLGKRYRIGQPKQQSALSHVIGDALRAPFRLLGVGSNPVSGANGGSGNGANRGESARARANKNANNGSPYIWALRDINFEVKEGEVVGLIGRNGAGKSTLLKILARVTRPTEGHAELHGRIGSLLEVGTGFHPELTGRENVFMSGAVLGMRAAEIRRKFDEIVAFSEVERFLDTPLKHFSSGMQMRLAFAVAAHLEPEILLVDEVLAVGDVSFQKKCIGKMGDVAKTGRTIVFVSHQANQIRRLCSRVMWVDAGTVRMTGASHEVVSAYEFSMSRGDRLPAESDRRPKDVSPTKGRFLRWEIQKDKSNPHTLDWLGPVTVQFSIEILTPIKLGHYGIALRNHERQLIWAWAAEPLRLEVGTHQLCHTFPMLPLQPGFYTWLTTLYEEGQLVDWWDCTPEMVVATELHQHPRDEWNGILNLPARFEINNIDERESTEHVGL